MKISLIIPAYNEEKYIKECLEYAIKNSNGKFSEIIVVDNASTDKTKEVVSSFPNVKIVTESKKGLVNVRQRGYLASTGDILAYIDADTKMPQGWVEKIEYEFSKNSNIGALSGPYIYYDIPRYQRFLVKYLYWYIISMPIYFIIGYLVVGGNFAIKRDVLEKMNGFDTSIEFYGEDTNIARRASAFSKVKFLPNFIMYTSGRRLNGEGFIKIAFIYMINFISEAIFKKPATKTYKDIR